MDDTTVWSTFTTNSCAYRLSWRKDRWWSMLHNRWTNIAENLLATVKSIRRLGDWWRQTTYSSRVRVCVSVRPFVVWATHLSEETCLWCGVALVDVFMSRLDINSATVQANHMSGRPKNYSALSRRGHGRTGPSRISFATHSPASAKPINHCTANN